MKNETTTYEIETSTDTPEEVAEALGTSVEIEESEAEEGEEQPVKPEVKPSKAAKEEPAEEEEPEFEEGEDEEDSEAEGSEEEEPKPKGKTPMVPKARLDQEIRRRKAAQAKLAEGAKPTVKEETESTEGKPPQFFSGKPEPLLETFMAGVDQYDPAAVNKANGLWMKAVREWDRAEARAEAAYESRVNAIKQQQIELTADFLDRAAEFKVVEPLYEELVEGNSAVMLSIFQEHFVYESEVGPQILLYFAQHPKEAERIRTMRARSQGDAMLTVEAKLVKQYGLDESAEENEEEPVRPKAKAPTVQPPKKAASKAPAPPSRIKSAGPGPRTEEDLAGTRDSEGVDVEFNPEYERAVNARRKT